MPESVTPVVVGVDGTYSAIQAARWAAAVAAKFAAPLSIVHADPPRGHRPSDAVAALRVDELAERRSSSEAILQAAEHAVRGDFSSLAVTSERMCGPIGEVLRDLSGCARMIVLGCDDVSLGAAFLVGSTTVAVATHSACPVVAWRGDLVCPNSQGIVLGVDGTRAGDGAIGAAFEFADRFGVGIAAVHAWPIRRPPVDVIVPSLIDWDAIEAAEWSMLMGALEPWEKRCPNVEVTYFVDPEKPSRALLRHAKDAQLVVVGSRGLGLLGGAVLGSTGLNLLHHSDVPVMICRPTETSTGDVPTAGRTP
jgi:nucleotide-binding universal stress UspA family protein